MYRITFAAGHKIVEVWEISDVHILSYRMKQINNNLQWWHQDLCYDECEYISAAVEKDDHTVLTVCETLINGSIYRYVWDTSKAYNNVYIRKYSLGGVR